ncbi:MAG: hypothetical protein H0V17_21190 [Deltaproteobacteria bacterium]|nr:hypothetical protein [Deltaproteobacteria bacterium]
MRAALVLIVATGCGRISFDEVRPGVDDGNPGDGVDGPRSDGPTDSSVRACATDAAYVASPSPNLTNRYREGAALVTWDQARADCMADDADLWVVESSLEQDAFTGDWTGITDAVTETSG